MDTHMVHARYAGVKAVTLAAACAVASSEQLSGVDRLHPVVELENEMSLHDVFVEAKSLESYWRAEQCFQLSATYISRYSISRCCYCALEACTN